MVLLHRHRGRMTVVHDSRAGFWSSRWLLAVVLAIVTMAAVAQYRAWAFLCDDAFIAFRYARHWAEYGRLEFNLGEPVEGYTNLGWVLLLGALSWGGIEPTRAAPALTAISMLLVFAGASRLLQTVRSSLVPLDAFSGLVVLLLVASPECVVWAHGGLETAAGTAATLAAMTAWLHGRWTRAALLALAAASFRLDALVAVACFGTAWLLVPSGGRRLMSKEGAWPKVAWAQAAVVFAVPMLGWFVWRHATYGTWWPNTWAIKADGALLRDTYGRDYVLAWAVAVGLPFVLVLVPWMRSRHLVLVAPIAGVVAYGYGVGGDFMAYSRFYLTATVLLAVLVAWIIAERVAAVEAQRGVAAGGVLFALGLVAAGVLGVQSYRRWQDDRGLGPRWIDGRWEGVTAMDRFAAVGWAAGRWMHDHLPPDTLVSVGAAGAMPYGSRLPIVDAYGLTDPVIPTLPGAGPHAGKGVRPGHQWFAPPAYIERRDPDLRCHVGYRGQVPPPSRQRPPGYARGFSWACVDVGRVRAGGDAFDGGYYCCLRPHDRLREVEGWHG